MKNNITRKTALKTICSLIIIILLSFNNFANAQVQNIPPELYTNGGLPNPLPKL